MRSEAISSKNVLTLWRINAYENTYVSQTHIHVYVQVICRYFEHLVMFDLLFITHECQIVNVKLKCPTFKKYSLIIREGENAFYAYGAQAVLNLWMNLAHVVRTTVIYLEGQFGRYKFWSVMDPSLLREQEQNTTTTNTLTQIFRLSILSNNTTYY